MIQAKLYDLAALYAPLAMSGRFVTWAVCFASHVMTQTGREQTLEQRVEVMLSYLAWSIIPWDRADNTSEKTEWALVQMSCHFTTWVRRSPFISCWNKNGSWNLKKNRSPKSVKVHIRERTTHLHQLHCTCNRLSTFPLLSGSTDLVFDVPRPIHISVNQDCRKFGLPKLPPVLSVASEGFCWMAARTMSMPKHWTIWTIIKNVTSKRALLSREFFTDSPWLSWLAWLTFTKVLMKDFSLFLAGLEEAADVTRRRLKESTATMWIKLSKTPSMDSWKCKMKLQIIQIAN